MKYLSLYTDFSDRARTPPLTKRRTDAHVPEFCQLAVASFKNRTIDVVINKQSVISRKLVIVMEYVHLRRKGSAACRSLLEKCSRSTQSLLEAPPPTGPDAFVCLPRESAKFRSHFSRNVTNGAAKLSSQPGSAKQCA